MPSWDGLKRSKVIRVILITCDLQSSFDLCLHFREWGLWFIVMCVWFLRFHAPTPTLIALQRSLKWINFTVSGCYELQPVFMLCVIIAQWRQRLTQVTCAMCRTSTKNVGTFHSRDSSISTCNARLPCLAVAAVAFFQFLTRFFYDIKLHHSKQLASFLFLITAALARPQAPECFCWSLQRICKCCSFQFYGWLLFFFIGFVAVCVLLIKTSKCFTVHWSFTLPCWSPSCNSSQRGIRWRSVLRTTSALRPSGLHYSSYPH